MIIHPQEKAPDQEKINQIRQWVERGNRVVLWAPVESDWTKAFQFHGFACLESVEKQVISMVTDPWLSEIKRVSWASGGCVRKEPHQENVLVNHQFYSLMVKQKLGQGEIYYIPETEMLMNSQIHAHDNLYLPIAVAEWTKGRIWFDETVHPWPPNMGSDSNPSAEPNSDHEREEPTQLPTVFDLFTLEIWVILFQILLLIFLYLYAKGKRFSAPRFESKTEKRDAMEYIEAMATWYQRAELRKEVLKESRQRLTRELHQRFHLSSKHSTAELEKMIRRYLGVSYLERYQKILELQKKWASKRKIPLFVFQHTAVEIKKLRKELHVWKTQTPNTNRR